MNMYAYKMRTRMTLEKGTDVRIKRSLWSMLIAVVLALAIAVPALAAASFTDVGSSPYQASITNLANWKIVGGYDDDTFRPDNPLQRQQFAKMIVLDMGLAVAATDVSTFADTPAALETNPLYPGSYVAVAAAHDIIKGYPDNTFRFYNNVTRQQVVTMVVRAAGDALDEVPAEWQAGVLDYTDPNHGENLKKAEYNGLLAGIANLASWDVTKNASRGEAAELLAKLLAKTGSLDTGASGAVKVSGLVDNPIGLTIDRLKNMGPITETLEHPKNGPTEYNGVLWSDVLVALGVQEAAQTVDIVASDGFTASMAIADIKAIPDALVVIGNGGKIHVAFPGQGSKYWVKDVVELIFK